MIQQQLLYCHFVHLANVCYRQLIFRTKKLN